MYNSIAISGTVADGYSTGDAIKAIEEVAEQVLPKGYGYDFGGLTREESRTGSQHGDHLRYLHHPDLPDSECSLRRAS